MKKKLAIFTLAVGFFTLCNVVFYTRKLRADEMTTTAFWHWSAQRLAAANNCSTVTLDEPQASSCNVSSAPDGVGGQANKLTTNASGSTVASPPLQDGGQSSTFYFVFNNQTHYLTVEGVRGAAISTQVALPTLNRTIRVTFNTSVFLEHGISVRTSGGMVLPLSLPVNLNQTPRASSSANQGENQLLTAPSMANEGKHQLLTGPSVVEKSARRPVIKAPSTVGNESQPLAAPSLTGNENKMPPVPSVNANETKSVAENATSGNGLTALNRHPFSYLINVPDLCAGSQPPTLVILVTTAVSHFAHRKAIRETWGGLAKRLPNVRLAFVMGRPIDPRAQYSVVREALQFADVVQEDFLDTYKNLTLKTVMLLRWVRDHCPAARFVMKSDDDVFINLPNLLKYIRSLRLDRKLLFGRLVKGARPLRSRSSKYFVPVTEYKDNVYPDYLSGTAYVMSGDVAPRLISVAEVTPIFFFEDVFITGICAKKAGIARRNHSGFVYYKRQVKGCAYYRVISGHNNTPNDMRKIWKDLQIKNLKCS